MRAHDGDVVRQEWYYCRCGSSKDARSERRRRRRRWAAGWMFSATKPDLVFTWLLLRGCHTLGEGDGASERTNGWAEWCWLMLRSERTAAVEMAGVGPVIDYASDRQTGTKTFRGWRRLSTPEERLCSKSTRVSKFASSTLAAGACQLLALPAIRRALVCSESSGARPHQACPSPDPCPLHSSQPVKLVRQS
jgi:hypothetical protein